MTDLPTHARVVILGGGISGCSLAYHLTKLGWTDVVLLEKGRLTSGTTWHAAGLVGQLRASRNLTRLAKYSADLYGALESETGLATGYRRVGSVSVALTADRQEELRRQAATARAFGIEVTELSSAEVGRHYPHLNLDGVVSGVHLPGDGQADPSNVALALAKGARMRGARIVEGVAATAVTHADGRVTGVDWQAGGDRGHVAAEHVVNCAGLWGRDMAASVGVTLPLQACEHFYVVTEPIAGLGDLPVLRVPDECAYYKTDAGKLLVGAFEPVAKPWDQRSLPPGAEFIELPPDMDQMAPVLEMAAARVPTFGSAGIHTFFNGPESFTPDDRYYLGEAPELDGYWVAAGYNSIGIASSGGAGMALAQWMADGAPPFDLWDVDIRRAQPFQRNRRYLRERVTETLGLLYADHYPDRPPVTARGVRLSPLHHVLAARGAAFGETAGWERPLWFAAPGETPEHRPGWGQPGWFPRHAAEHRTLREGAGLLDLSSFGKIRVEGPGALALLQRVCTGDMDIAAGRIRYTLMLNARGGIEMDLTVTRLSETAFLLVVPSTTVPRVMAWLRRQQGDALAVVTDVTSGEAVLAVMGPNARDIMTRVSPDDWSDAAHPFGTAREVEVGMAVARAHRISYVGELGWELYVPTEMAAGVAEALIEAGVTPCGLLAMDSARLEKAYRHWGHDITDEDGPDEAGLGFALSMRKGDFLGRDAVLRGREAGLGRRLVQFRLSEPGAMLHHNEPILRDGRIVGQMTSGRYGHSLGGAVGLGYVPCSQPGETADSLLASAYAVDVAGARVEAVASLAPMWDPDGRRMRG